MVEMLASRTPVVRCAGAAAAVLALAGLAGCGSTKTSTSSATTSLPAVTQTATTGTDAGSGDATSTGTSTSDGSGTGTSTTDRTGTSTSTSTSWSTHSATGTSTSTATRTVTSTASATGSASSTTGAGTSADTHECRTGQLRAGAYPYSSSTSRPETAVTFTNTSSAACTMRGYPGADIQLDGGRVVHAQRFRNAPLETVVLRPGATARAILEGQSGGSDSGFLVVTPPNQHQSMPVQIVLPAKGFKVGPVTLDAGH